MSFLLLASSCSPCTAATFRCSEQSKPERADISLKNKIRKELPDAIRAAHAGRKNIPPEIAAEIAEHFDQEGLTQREQEVLQFVAEGNMNKEVAVRLGISEETVKAHMRNLLAKLGANDRTHAVMIALRRGIITTRLAH